MNRPYNELVGILVTFPKPVRNYRVDYIYRYKTASEWGDVLTQCGLDWVLLTSKKVVKRGLGDAFASVIHAIWTQDAKQYEQVFYQLVGLQTPSVLELPGGWCKLVEW